MLLAVSFLFFGACLVSSNPVKKSYSDQELYSGSRGHLQFKDEFLIREERGSKCTYGGEEYEKGTTLDIPVELNYERCDRCKCIRGKFRKCTTISYCHLQCDEIEFLPDQCCPVCKRKSCGEEREVNDQWQQIKSLTGPNEGICSFCECRADRKEYCTDNQFQCFDIPECLETEMKPDFCCSQCKTWASSATTTQPSFTIEITEETPPFTFPFDFRENKEP